MDDSPFFNFTTFCITALILIILILFYQSYAIYIMTWFKSWLISNREEKVSLTRTMGHYNANGYLIHSDSNDIQLCATGSFKRFDSVDGDCKLTIATSSFGGEWAAPEENNAIPPQPLRPAPVSPPTLGKLGAPIVVTPTPPMKQSFSPDGLEKTSISPIPRPVSSVNMAALNAQSSSSSTFPAITPPPSTSNQPATIPEKETSKETTVFDFQETAPPVNTGTKKKVPLPAQRRSSLYSDFDFMKVKKKLAEENRRTLSTLEYTKTLKELMLSQQRRASLDSSWTSACSSASTSWSQDQPSCSTSQVLVEEELPKTLMKADDEPGPSKEALEANQSEINERVAQQLERQNSLDERIARILERKRTREEAEAVEQRVSSSSDDVDSGPPEYQLKRAISCESVCSDSSIAVDDMEEVNVTGYLCIGLEFESDYSDLLVNVIEAKDLLLSTNTDECSALLETTYVRVFLLPNDKATIQTKLCPSSNNPSYKERFIFGMHPMDQCLSTLVFHVYCTDEETHVCLGEGEIRLGEISLKTPVTTWVTLTDTGQRGTEFGQVMFSLSYLPTAERLTVVIVKARNLKFEKEPVGDSFIKVYLMNQNKKVNKKKTTIKKSERSPIFNEAMMFNVPVHALGSIQLRVTAVQTSLTRSVTRGEYAIGHVIVGSDATGRALGHWNQMLTTLRKPVAMWHTLRK